MWETNKKKFNDTSQNHPAKAFSTAMQLSAVKIESIVLRRTQEHTLAE